MKCRICSREAKKTGFCVVHLAAYSNVLEKFEVWQRASGVNWRTYLEEIQKNSLTGVWAKEVTKHLIEDEKRSSHVWKNEENL